MAVTRIATAKYTPTSSITSRTLTLPAAIQVGDTIWIQVVTASGAAAATVSVTGMSGITLVKEQIFSGHRHLVYVKEGAVAEDSGAVLTITTGTALRVTVQALVQRGTPLSGVVDKVGGINGPLTAVTSITSPSVVTAASATVELQFVAASGNPGVTAFTNPSGITEVSDSYDLGTAGGSSYAIIGENLTQAPAGSTPGSDVWGINTAALMSAITVSVKVLVAATSVRPSSTVTGTGWTNVGGAASLEAAVADDSDATYAESGDNPSGAQPVNFALPEVGPGPLTLRVRGSASAASPLISRTVTLRQGTTVIASRTTTLSTSPTDFEWTTTTAEANAITDRTQLRVAITDVVQ